MADAESPEDEDLPKSKDMAAPPSKPKLRVGTVPQPKPRRRSRKPEQRPSRQSDLVETIARWILTTLILVSPWVFGATSAFSQLVIASGLLVVCGLWFVHDLMKTDKSRFHMLSIPLVLFLLLGFFQVVPLPGFAESRLAKQQQKIRDSLAQSIERNHAELAETLRDQSMISINPTATYVQLGTFVLGVIGFLAAARFYFSRRDTFQLATLVMFNGVLLAVFGAFQKVATSKSIYGIELPAGNPFASFINRNNAAGYLLICLGCAISVVIYSFSQIKKKKQEKESSRRSKFLTKVSREFQQIFANLNVWRICLLVFCGLIMAAIAISLSRGGVIAMAVGVVMILLFLFRHGQIRGMILLLIFLLPFGGGALVWSGLQEDVGNRMSTLSEADAMDKELRWTHWQDSLGAVEDYPFVGSGLGTYRYVYREYRSDEDRHWFYHAENVFLEILVIGGVAGFILLAIPLGWILFLAASMPSKEGNMMNLALGVLGFFVLSTQAVSNFFDFGLFIPANLLLFSVMMGTVVGASSSHQAKRKLRQVRFRTLLPKWTKWPVYVLVFASLIFTLPTFWNSHTRRSAIRSVEYVDLDEASVSDLSGWIESLEKTPPNLEVHEYLATLYVTRFQRKLAEQRNNSIRFKEMEPEAIADLSTIRMLNFDLAMMTPDERLAELTSIREAKFFQENIPQALNHSLAAIEACPTSTRSLTLMGEIANLTDNKVNAYFNSFGQFNVTNPQLLRRMGDLAAAYRLKDIAFRYWNSAMKFSPATYQAAVPAALMFFKKEDVCQSLIPDDTDILIASADTYFQSPTDIEYRQILFRRVRDILNTKATNDADVLHKMGRALRELGEFSRAILYYEKATNLAPLNTAWKVQLADLYFINGDISKCMEIVSELETTDPKDPALQNLKRRRELDKE